MFARLVRRLRADIDIHLIRLRHIEFLFFGEHMNRLEPNNAAYLFIADLHASAEINTGIDAADGREFEHTLIGYISDDHADLVHMGVEHNFIFRGALSLFVHDKIAERIDAPIGEAVYLGDYELAHLIFPAGHAAYRAEFFEQSVHHARPLSIIYAAISRATASISFRSTISAAVCIFLCGIEMSPILTPLPAT